MACNVTLLMRTVTTSDLLVTTRVGNVAMLMGTVTMSDLLVTMLVGIVTTC